MQENDQLKIKCRNLPHWTLKGSVYFITFCKNENEFSKNEQILILNHIKEGHNKFYKLHAVVVMPDHVHIVLELLEGYDLSRVTKGIKGVTANKINKLRNTKGVVWQHESFDRIIRDEKEYEGIIAYMLNNPVEKGLTDDTRKYNGWYFNENIYDEK